MKERGWDMNRKLFVVLFMALTASCTVKEDRVECPCEFTLDVSECRITDDVLSFSLWDGQTRKVNDHFNADDLGRKYNYQLDRKVFRASAYTGDSNSLHEGSRLLVKYGMQADSLYAWAMDIDARGENANEIVLLHKQFATITFDLSEYDSADTPLRVCITSSYGGLDILSLSPVKNDFLYEFTTDGSCLYPVRLTRQGDNSLVMDIYSGNTPLAKINVGSIIAASGYDWCATDLSDITVTVTASDAEVWIEPAPWTEIDTQTVSAS